MSVVKFQFSYCPLIWIFTSQYLNNALNSIHERAMYNDLFYTALQESLIYNVYELPFGIILEDNKQKSIHQKNIESLATEIYKFQAGLTPTIMSDLFLARENNYNLRNFQELESSLRRTVKFETENYFLQGTSNMEPDFGKIKDIGNIK